MTQARNTEWRKAWIPVALVVATLTAAAADNQPLTFADFEAGKAECVSGTEWTTYSDKSAGGTSTAWLQMVPGGAPGSTKALRLEGTVTPDFQYGYAGARALINPDGTPRDLSRYQGVRFWVRGNEDVYKLQIIKASVSGFNDFQKPFLAPAKWTLVEVPFEALRQPPWGHQTPWSSRDIRGVGIHTADGLLGEYFVEIDQIEFY
jgi:hypothetical protein